MKTEKKLVKFEPRYLTVAVGLFFIEVLIALYVNDIFIRPYLGDVIVVILLYCLTKAFMDIRFPIAVLVTLLFSFFVEILQYLNFVYLIGLGESRLANIVFGNSFAWADLLAYTFGACLIIIFELSKKAIVNLK